MEHPIKMDDLGFFSLIFGNHHMEAWKNGVMHLRVGLSDKEYEAQSKQLAKL